MCCYVKKCPVLQIPLTQFLCACLPFSGMGIISGTNPRDWSFNSTKSEFQLQAVQATEYSWEFAHFGSNCLPQ